MVKPGRRRSAGSKAALSPTRINQYGCLPRPAVGGKTLKAALEESDIASFKTHSLTRLYSLLSSRMSISIKQDMLDRLEAVYIQSRYPGEMGLLPYGKPTQTEAQEFYSFAQQLYNQIQAALETAEDSDSPE